jgi:hypothetical protein
MLGNSKQLAALLIIAIAASGCQTENDTSASTSPVKVNNFDAVPDPAPAGQTVNFHLELENTGDVDAEDVAARIFGPSFGSEGERVWTPSNGNEDLSKKGPRTDSLPNALRAPTEDNPSIPKQLRWSFTAPSLGENREIDYNFYAKFFYSYSTTGETEFKLVSDERRREQGYSQGEADIENTDGPVQLDIRGTTPKVYYEDSEEKLSEICITVKNSGSGQVFTGGKVTGSPREYNMKEADEGTVELSIQDVGEVSFNPTTDTGGKVELVGDTGYKCYEMDAGSLQTEEKNINTQVTASYNYVEEDSTSVTVEGRRE